MRQIIAYLSKVTQTLPITEQSSVILHMEQDAGFEPVPSPWKGDMLSIEHQSCIQEESLLQLRKEKQKVKQTTFTALSALVLKPAPWVFTIYLVQTSCSVYNSVEAMTEFHGDFTKEHLIVVTYYLKSLLRLVFTHKKVSQAYHLVFPTHFAWWISCLPLYFLLTFLYQP